MSRTYTLRRRAEQQAQTRLRIVDTAIGLHSTVGPAQTTFSMVAEHAGVQRHTLYAHFPDERSLLLACSGLHMERDPLPDADPWRAIEDRHERLRVGLNALYGWYERNAELAACVLRDAEIHDLTREIAGMRFGPYFSAHRQVLGEGLAAKPHAMLLVALSYFTWRTLTQDACLERAAAVEAMVEAIYPAGAPLAR